jgi:hypothetical protein
VIGVDQLGSDSSAILVEQSTLLSALSGELAILLSLLGGSDAPSFPAIVEDTESGGHGTAEDDDREELHARLRELEPEVPDSEVKIAPKAMNATATAAATTGASHHGSRLIRSTMPP